MPRKRRQLRAATDHPPAAAVSMELAMDNDDMVMQILLFLPAKLLIRFKSVCKKWLFLISSDNFCHQHTLRHPKLQQSIIIQMQSLQLFYLNQTTNGEKVTIPYSLSVLDKHQIVQACSGLMLLESKRRRHSYYVYNPTTRRLRKISLTKRNDFPHVVAVTLAFDPSKSPYYKVVCFRSPIAHNPQYNDCYVCEVEVYDSKSHTWKHNLKLRGYARICNKGLYWNNYIFRRDHVGSKFCFDNAASNYLQESNGHLYQFVLHKNGRYASVGGRALWEMRGDDMLLSNYLGTIRQHSDMDTSGVYLMVRSSGDGSSCNVITYEVERRRIMAYNLLDEGFELLMDLTRQPVSEFDHVADVFQFGEVLAVV